MYQIIAVNNTNDILKLFEKSKDEMVLIIKERNSENPISYGKVLEAKEMLTFTMEGLVYTAHFIYPASMQCYHSFNFIETHIVALKYSTYH
jgi:hypothetical protein